MRLKYIIDLLVEYKPSRALRSLGLSQLVEPQVKTKQAENAFSYDAAHRWNKPPDDIKCVPTLHTFKVKLNTLLFSCAFV